MENASCRRLKPTARLQQTCLSSQSMLTAQGSPEDVYGLQLLSSVKQMLGRAENTDKLRPKRLY